MRACGVSAFLLCVAFPVAADHVLVGEAGQVLGGSRRDWIPIGQDKDPQAAESRECEPRLGDVVMTQIIVALYGCVQQVYFVMILIFLQENTGFVHVHWFFGTLSRSLIR